MTGRVPQPAADPWRREADLLVEACTPGQRTALLADPLGAVMAWDGVAAELREEVRTTGQCNTDGLYDPDADPPRIVIAASASWPRRAFTALHELGHHLSLRHPEVADLLWRPGGDRVAEEICDTFAAAVLIPDDVLAGVFSTPGPTAAQVRTLFRTAEHASRAACCVAASRLLRIEGYVVVADLDRVVQYAASVHTPYRLSRGVPQPDHGLLADAAVRGRANGPCHIRFRDGDLSSSLAGDAVRDGGYVFAVMVSGAPPWGGAWDAPTDRWATPAERDCPHCGAVWEGFATERCDRCRQPPCPECDRCACASQGRAPQVCSSCGLLTAAFAPGATVCNDCS